MTGLVVKTRLSLTGANDSDEAGIQQHTFDADINTETRFPPSDLECEATRHGARPATVISHAIVRQDCEYRPCKESIATALHFKQAFVPGIHPLLKDPDFTRKMADGTLDDNYRAAAELLGHLAQLKRDRHLARNYRPRIIHRNQRVRAGDIIQTNTVDTLFKRQQHDNPSGSDRRADHWRCPGIFVGVHFAMVFNVENVQGMKRMDVCWLGTHGGKAESIATEAVKVNADAIALILRERDRKPETCPEALQVLRISSDDNRFNEKTIGILDFRKIDQISCDSDFKIVGHLVHRDREMLGNLIRQSVVKKTSALMSGFDYAGVPTAPAAMQDRRRTSDWRPLTPEALPRKRRRESEGDEDNGRGNGTTSESPASWSQGRTRTRFTTPQWRATTAYVVQTGSMTRLASALDRGAQLETPTRQRTIARSLHNQTSPSRASRTPRQPGLCQRLDPRTNTPKRHRGSYSEASDRDFNIMTPEEAERIVDAA